MLRRPPTLVALLLAALAFLAPLAAVADACTDCLGGDSPGCCPPSCCGCCAHAPAGLAATLTGRLQAVPSEAAAVAPVSPSPASPPRDIFHVPKPARA
jgi:hypothetical protein